MDMQGWSVSYPSKDFSAIEYPSLLHQLKKKQEGSTFSPLVDYPGVQFVGLTGVGVPPGVAPPPAGVPPPVDGELDAT